MYNSYAYGISSPPLTNNPFIDDTASTAQRFPDISQPPIVVGTGNQSAWGSGSANARYSGQQQLQYSHHQQQQQQSQMYQPQFQQPTMTGFQTQGSYGQGVVSGSSYSYLNGAQQQQQQQQQGYNPAQQQLQSPSYIAQFDPYAALGQGWGETTTTTVTTGGLVPTSGTGTSTGSYTSSPSSLHISTPAPGAAATSLSAAGDQHPREYIRAHKALIESWDSFTWKAFLGLFDKLKAAWEQRKRELDARVGVLNTQVATLQMQTQAAGALGYSGYMQVQQYQQEVARVQGLAKEAEINFDSVAASTFQMQEVFGGYRQSGDLASKRRVREATNAALHSLPDWPQPFF